MSFQNTISMKEFCKRNCGSMSKEKFYEEYYRIIHTAYLRCEGRPCIETIRDDFENSFGSKLDNISISYIYATTKYLVYDVVVSSLLGDGRIDSQYYYNKLVIDIGFDELSAAHSFELCQHFVAVRFQAFAGGALPHRQGVSGGDRVPQRHAEDLQGPQGSGKETGERAGIPFLHGTIRKEGGKSLHAGGFSGSLEPSGRVRQDGRFGRPGRSRPFHRPCQQGTGIPRGLPCGNGTQCLPP